MDLNKIIKELSINKSVFIGLLDGLTEEEYMWKQSSEKWCLLEIVCHLYDEEREDFRARTKHVLETNTEPIPPINPPNWVQERQYIKQNYRDKLNNFIKERENSIAWLISLKSPNWDYSYEHAKFGQMTAIMFVTNWVAHDYLHIRQILKLKFDYLKHLTDESFNYAGDW